MAGLSAFRFEWWGNVGSGRTGGRSLTALFSECGFEVLAVPFYATPCFGTDDWAVKTVAE